MTVRPGPAAAFFLALTLPTACFDKPDGYVEESGSGGLLGVPADGGGSAEGAGANGGGGGGNGVCEAFADAVTSCFDEAGIESDTGFGDPCADYLPEYDGYYQCITSAYSPGLCATDSGLSAFLGAAEACAESYD